MKILIRLCALWITASMSVLACEQPPLPLIPGDVGSSQESQQILLAMQRYVSSMTDYVGCIQSELAAAGGDDIPSLQGTLLVRRNNAAVHEANVVTELFEERVGLIESVRLGEVIRADALDCVALTQSRTTDVLDDRAVLVHGQGDRIYLNLLPERCPALLRPHSVIFETRGALVGRLCRQDVITLIDQVGAYLACEVGDFYPISEAQAERLLRPRSQRAGDRR